MVANSFSKRKATVQQESLQDLGEALKEKEEGKRPRRSAAKDTPRRTSARRASARSKKAKEADKQASSARETGGTGDHRGVGESRIPDYQAVEQGDPRSRRGRYL